MKRRWIVVAAVLTVGLTAVLFGAFYHPSPPLEPSYQGRRLRDWLDDIAFRSSEERAGGEKALLAIGTNAIPFLLWELQVQHSPGKRKCITWVCQQKWLAPFRGKFGIWQNPTEEGHHERAVKGFQVLSTAAESTIPILAELVKCPTTGLNATRILAEHDSRGRLYFGSEVFAPLLIALTNQNPEVRRLAANGLNLAQTNAPVVVPALLRALQDPDPGVRAMAAISLGGPTYKSQAQAIVPALIKCLDDTNALVRARATKRLGLLHGAARSALPALSRLLSDPDGDVRESAETAIAQILPDKKADEKQGDDMD